MQFGEVYTALQTGVVDGQENPLATIDAGKFYEVQKYLALSNHVWNGFWMLANGDAWNRLPEDIRRSSTPASTKRRSCSGTTSPRLNKGLADQLKSKGMEITSPDTDSFRAKLRRSRILRDMAR